MKIVLISINTMKFIKTDANSLIDIHFLIKIIIFINKNYKKKLSLKVLKKEKNSC